GRLTEANARREDSALLDRLRTAAATCGCGVDQVALAFVLERPFVDVVLSGAATAAQLSSHTGALEVTLDDPTHSALAVLRESPEDYWRTRASLPWS
ncbi:MAG TPA: aldo/keto reductase, partial [Candidatus Binatus sp.]|nr:aldo/keto reductase [Candidatus Binatus sp.]